MSTRIAGEYFHFAPPRDAGWPEAWRDLDRAVWRWVRAHGGDAATARAAAWASHADGQGHSALPLWLAGVDGKPLLDADHCAALADRYAQMAKELREGIDQTDEAGDADTSDLLTQVSRELDKMLWMIEAHLQGKN